jgi:hypothetical protein
MKANSKKMIVTTIPVSQVDVSLREQMWKLYSAYYQRACQEKFASDLNAKHFVFVGRDGETGEFCGFSTAEITKYHFQGRSVGVLFSGDTMIHPDYWGQLSLHKAFLLAGLKWKLRSPLTPLYWNLVASGYRTYLIMAKNFPTYWPRYNQATPAWERDLISFISEEKFGGSWCPRERVIDARDEGYLKDAVAPITQDLIQIPEIKFFLGANPKHREGAELPSIAKIDLALVFRCAAKWLRKSWLKASPSQRKTAAAAETVYATR